MQLRFSRADEPSPSAYSDQSLSPRRVTFAAPSRAPSTVYESQNESETKIPKIVPRRRVTPQRSLTETKPVSPYAKQKEFRRSKTRRPGWDDDSHGSTLFDTSLKRSALFQPRAGDRLREVKQEQQQEAPVRKTQGLSGQRRTAASRTPVRYRSGPSSVYEQQRNATHWPTRNRKDFVKKNIESLTGGPVYTRTRNATPSRRRENVFERLSANRVSKTLLRSHALPVETGVDRDARATRSPSVSSLSPPRPAPSPGLTIETPDPVVQLSSRSKSPSPSPTPQRSQSSPTWPPVYSSSQPSQQSYATQRSPAPRSTSTNRTSQRSTRRRQGQDNYRARVFAVLDRENEQRIGVNQILQGLRLLGLPATHNQISDYVYLIHEGRHSTIDLEEWEILVGTLDAASRPSGNSPRGVHNTRDSAVPSRSLAPQHIPGRQSRSPYSRSDHFDSPPSKEVNQGGSPRTSTRNRLSSQHQGNGDYYLASSHREPIVSAEYQTIHDDPYLEEIQHRIEGMFERAQATAALRYPSEPRGNQFDNGLCHSDRILKRAASVVYGLRASLFPLVHQAETNLREIQQRHGSKLSLFLPPAELSAIAQNSDVLATAILDDLLLDTVQLLNDEDQRKTRCQLDSHHAHQLDDILARIHEIEQEENNMIRQGLALNYTTTGVKCNLPTASVPTGEGGTPRNRSNISDLTLPLEVVMNIDVTEDNISSSHCDSQGIGLDDRFLSLQNDIAMSSQSTTAIVGTSVSASILQGKRLQSIEKRRHKFEQHRRLVESSLAGTGMSQCGVIEVLEEMLLDDLVEETAAELSETVVSLSDMLMTSLL